MRFSSNLVFTKSCTIQYDKLFTTGFQRPWSGFPGDEITPTATGRSTTSPPWSQQRKSSPLSLQRQVLVGCARAHMSHRRVGFQKVVEPARTLHPVRRAHTLTPLPRRCSYPSPLEPLKFPSRGRTSLSLVQSGRQHGVSLPLIQIALLSFRWRNFHLHCRSRRHRHCWPKTTPAGQQRRMTHTLFVLR